MTQTNNITKTLIDKIQSLPIEQQQMLLDFVEFLDQKYPHNRQKRVLGLHQGQIWMSEEFNEPLSLANSLNIYL